MLSVHRLSVDDRRMVSPRDLTGDLVKLRKPLAAPPPEKAPHAPLPLRTLAFDPVLWLAAMAVGGTLVFQLALLFWLG